MSIPDALCDTIVHENQDIASQKMEMLRKWRHLKKQTWKGFIRVIALLGLCTKAQDLAKENSVTFESRYSDDKRVLESCEDINDQNVWS